MKQLIGAMTKIESEIIQDGQFKFSLIFSVDITAKTGNYLITYGTIKIYDT